MKTLLIGPRSKMNLTHGMSMAFDLLETGFNERNLEYLVIDRSYKQSDVVVGSVFFSGIVQTLYLLLRVYLNLFLVDNIYITIGTSRAGLLKDALMIWPSWILNKRIVLHLHGGGLLSFYEQNPKFLKSLMQKTYGKSDILIVLGELLRNQFEYLEGYESKIRVVSNSLNIIPPNVQPKQINLKEPFRILYLSNLIPSKGYLDVLKTCHILFNKRDIPIHCDFCGAFISIVDGEIKQSAEEAEQFFFQRINEYNLNKAVTYHGVVRGDQKASLLESANVLILPTNYPWEGQPISIIEALAFGNPVISTPYRGIPEEVIDGYNGYLVEFGDIDQIVNKVEDMWNSPEQYNQMSKNAIIHYQEHFTREVHLNRLIPLITNESESIA